MDEIIGAAREDLSFAEKAGLFAAVSVIVKNIEEYIDEDVEGDGYAHEKITQVQWHVGAALGFDITNGQSAEQHRGWALGALSSLKSALKQRGIWINE